jgi:ubiquinone/menaquinone biosynthesis C-methylase UbiE
LPTKSTSTPERWSAKAASQFGDPVMAADYAARDPYAEEAFQLIFSLMKNPFILDIGCGSGHVAIPASRYGFVDAVDISHAMIQMGQQSAQVNRSNIRWHVGTVEALAAMNKLHKNYSVVTAGECIHWFNWDTLFPTLRKITLPGAKIIMPKRIKVIDAWHANEQALLAKYDTEPPVGSFYFINALQDGGFIRLEGDMNSTPITIRKTVEDYIREIFSRNGFSRELLGATRTRALTRDFEHMLRPHLIDGMVIYQSYTRIRYGEIT